jgi:hypothetical protein
VVPEGFTAIDEDAGTAAGGEPVITRPALQQVANSTRNADRVVAGVAANDIPPGDTIAKRRTEPIVAAAAGESTWSRPLPAITVAAASACPFGPVSSSPPSAARTRAATVS